MQESVKGSEKAGFGQLFLFQNLNLKKSTGLPPRSSAPQRFMALPPAPPYPATFGPSASSPRSDTSGPAPHRPRSDTSGPAPLRPAPPLSALRLIAPAPPLSAPGLIIPAPPLSAKRINASAAPASSAFKAPPCRHQPCASSPTSTLFVHVFP